MTLTRRIEIFICEKDRDLKKRLYSQLFNWRYQIVNGANELLSYLYSLDRLKYYKFITEQTKIDIGIIGARGEPVKEGSGSYVLLSQRMKGEVPTDILNCLQKSVLSKYKYLKPTLFKGGCSLFTYKNNTPVPFSSNSVKHLRFNAESGLYQFTLFGIQFGITLGRDRSNNKKLLDNCISGTYKICESAILIDDSRNKIFLLLSYNSKAKELILDESRCIKASLSIDIPIIAKYEKEEKFIGNRDEFLYRRVQIQAAVRRAQINSKFSTGGRGRKRKLMAIERFHNKERDYIKTRIHTYSKMLVDFAVNNRCKYIQLVNQTEKESNAKKEKFLLRNWSYYGLKKCIEYKAKAKGIDVRVVD
ncbi:MAG: hypothetical protein Q8R90_06270 [Bacteroidales bacterium]|jgi:IS605 OrfB family transposase|nr:hypothetical protein [Bacteroidales bacterium]